MSAGLCLGLLAGQLTAVLQQNLCHVLPLLGREPEQPHPGPEKRPHAVGGHLGGGGGGQELQREGGALDSYMR